MSEWLADLFQGIRREARKQGFAEEIYGSAEEWPLVSLVRKEPDKPTVYLSSGMHGDEPAGVEAMLELFRAGLLSDQFSWCVCPVLNPVGLSRGIRENGEGVDMNRDYLSLKSAEVRSHRAWLEKQEVPLMFLSLHEDWESTGFYYYEIAKQEGDEIYRALREKVEAIMPMESAEQIDDHATREEGWIHHPARPDRPEDWPEAIFLAERGCPCSYTLETPSSFPLAQRIDTHVAVVSYLLERAVEISAGTKS